MASGKTARAFLDGFGAARSVLELDSLTADEILGALDPDPGNDALLTPWKQGYRAGIRSAFGY